jgi:hypothetical protein
MVLPLVDPVGKNFDLAVVEEAVGHRAAAPGGVE